MDARAFSASFEAPPPELQPVAVTRWSARLADPEIEHDYRQRRFPEDRRRAMLLMGLAAVVNSLNFLVELYAYSRGASVAPALIPPFTGVLLPIIGLLVVSQLRSPALLEVAMVACAAVAIILRLGVVSLHPALTYMWPTLMVGLMFVIYLYMPVRLVTSVALAVVLSIVTPAWWSWSLGSALPPDELFRGIIWLLFANALGFVAANSLQRSQRKEFAQTLVLQQLLSTDALTGIPNRRRFDEALAREWRRCARARAPISLLMIDIDHFKAYNDHCGHQRGDECLRRVARLLVDGVGRPGDLVARYGGEEFVCLLPEVGQAGARAVATRLIAALHRAAIPHPASPLGSRLTVSIGVATAEDLSGPETALFALADKLLYAAKNAGRHQFAIGELDERRPAARARAA
jgi:diguanylate cyclase (GGDEF)-like protein